MYIPPKPTPPSEILAGCVAVWRDAWSEPKRTIELLEQEIKNEESASWVKAKVGIYNGEYRPNTRNNYNLSLTQIGELSETLRGIHNNIFEMIFATSHWYRNYFNIAEEVIVAEDLMALKYSTGEEFKGHYDGGSLSKRVISPILYLNDDYEGGELEFVNFNLKIKPKAGDFYIFPSSFAYTHIAHPVTSGTKYAVVTWLHDQAN